MKALLLAPMGSVHRRFNTANIRALQSMGYVVHLAANFEKSEGAESENQEFSKECTGSGIVVHSILYQRHSLRKNIFKVKETRELLKREGYDLVHVHTETGGLILRMVGRPQKKTHYIYTPHGMSFYQGSSIRTQLLYRPVERWICEGMDKNIAINQEEYSVLKKWNPDTAEFVHGIGLNLQQFQNVQRSRESVRTELGIPKHAKVILSIGELDDNKNHRIVIEALAALNREDVYYLVCGVGANWKALITLAVSYGIDNRVILAGYRSDIPDVIKASDVYAFPSLHEGLPVSLMEAMAGGLPVVCSKIRGNVDLIRNSDNGLLAHPNDITQWSRLLSQLLSDEGMRIAYSKKSTGVIRNYSTEVVVDELVRCYR